MVKDIVLNQVKYLLPDRLRNNIHPRLLHAFCIGSPKSGTTSFAAIFDQNYRASHEPDRVDMIKVINTHYQNIISDQQYIDWLIKRDKRIWLDIESTGFLGYRPDLLYRAYPDSKYILTIREPLSWMDSMMNHTINYPPTSEDVIAMWHEIFFQEKLNPFSEKDRVLKQHKVYSIEAYLKYWSQSFQSIVNTFPEDKLLVMKTEDIKSKPELVADFLDVSTSTLNLGDGHKNVAPEKYNLLSLVSDEYIEEMLEVHCRSSITRLKNEFGIDFQVN